MEKEGRRDDRYIDGYNPVCTLGVQLRTRKFLQVLTISPRICRACRPTPCPHSACECDAYGVHSPKQGGAGGPPRSFARDRAKPRSAAALWRVRCAPRPMVCGARPGRTGSAGYAADRTPAGAGALRRWGAVRCAVCRQMRGGGTLDRNPKQSRWALSTRGVEELEFILGLASARIANSGTVPVYRAGTPHHRQPGGLDRQLGR
jgi:hypothetical protein